MFRRRGVTLTKALLTVVCMLAALFDTGDFGRQSDFSLPSETDFVSKRVVNNNKSARIYRIAISAIDSRAAVNCAPDRWMVNYFSPPPAGVAGW